MNKPMVRFLLYSVALMLVLALGCNTTQAPERQTDDTAIERRIDDTAITTSVKSQLATDIELSTITGIEVNTTNGVVTLSGQVSSDAVKRRAGEIAETVEGVVRVTNNLQVSTSSD